MRLHSSAYVAKDGVSGCAHYCHNRLNSFVSSSPPTVVVSMVKSRCSRTGEVCNWGRHGARYILLKYLRQAGSSMPSLGRPAISPHTLRHTKGMHLLQSGVPLVMVKDFLGHVDIKSTEVYVQADLDMKRKALESATGPHPTQPAEALPSGLIEWLESL